MHSVSEEVCQWHAEICSDPQEPADAGIGGAGFDALNGQTRNPGAIAQLLLAEVGVLPFGPDAVADRLASSDDPVRVGFAWHSTHAQAPAIMSQPTQAYI